MTATSRKIILTAGSIVFSLLLQPATVRATAAPVLGPSAELVAGQARTPSSKNIATDGNNFYMALQTEESDSDKSMIKVVRIPNAGNAPQLTVTALTRPAGQLTSELSLAVSDDGASSGAKTVHLIWREQSENKSGLYYSWSNDLKLDNWSAPVRINGNNVNSSSFSIVVNKKGDKHVIFIGDGPKMYYTKAAAGSADFSEPAELPGTPLLDSRSVVTALDPGGTLHVAFIATAVTSSEATETLGLQHTSLKASAKKWSPPTKVIPMATISEKGEVSLAAADSQGIYIASSLNRSNLEVFKSLDGGASWTKSIVATGRPHNEPSIAVAPDKSVTVGSGFDTAGEMVQEARIFRSADGLTWSPAAIIPDRTSVVIMLDDNGKTAVFTRGSTGTNDAMNYISKEK